MKPKNLLLSVVGLILVFSPAFSWAIPLSIEENMKAIASNPSGINGGFTFIVFGDSRGNEKKFLGILDKAKAFKPLFILNTGDIVQEGQTEEYENYKKQIEGYEIPILHIPGNHDLRSGKDNYQRYIGETNWYFDYGNYRLIGLDNTLGKFDEKTLEFARNTLNKKKLCFVAFHKPPAIGRWIVHSMLNDTNGGRGGELMDLIEKAEVPLVFHGHIHLYDEMTIKGSKYIISAGGGATLYSKYGFGKPEYGFLLVQVDSKGISSQWVPLE